MAQGNLTLRVRIRHGPASVPRWNFVRVIDDEDTDRVFTRFGPEAKLILEHIENRRYRTRIFGVGEWHPEITGFDVIEAIEPSDAATTEQSRSRGSLVSFGPAFAIVNS
jgi:hypothetical protein